MRLVLDVPGHQHRLAARLLHPARRLAGVLVLVEVGDQDVGTLAGEGDGDGAADPGVAAGDDGGTPAQPAAALVALLAMVGPGVHLAGQARHVLLLPRLRRLLVSGGRIKRHAKAS